MDTEEYEKDLSLMSPFTITRDSFYFLRHKFWKIAKVILLPFAAYILIALVFGFVIFSTLYGPALENPNFPAFSIVLLTTIVFFLIYIFINLWSQVAMMMTVWSIHKDRDDTTIELYKRSLPLVLPFTGVLILMSVSMFGGFSLFMIPGVIIAVYLSIALFVKVFEPEHKGFSPLTRSFQLVRKRWWDVFGRIFFLVLIGLTFLIIFQFLYFTAASSESSLLIVSIIDFLVQTFVVSPVFVIYMYMLYRDLVQNDPEPSGNDEVSILIKVFFSVGLLVLIGIPTLIWYLLF